MEPKCLPLRSTTVYFRNDQRIWLTLLNMAFTSFEMDELYKLRWHSFPEHFQQMLADTINDEHDHDVILVSEEKIKVGAHRIVLNACSPLFKESFNYNNDPTAYIYLSDFKHKEIESLLQLMYLGELNVKKERIQELLDAATVLGLKDIEIPITPFEDSVQDSKPKRKRKKKKPKTLLCENPNCTFVTTGNYTLEKHMKERHSFNCKECGEMFKEKHDLKIHIGSLHKGKEVHSCSQCEKSYFNPKLLVKHEYEVHKLPSLSCQQCAERFQDKHDLNIHIGAEHEGREVLQCTNCEKSYLDKRSLVRHKYEAHKIPKAKSIKCNLCHFMGVSEFTMQRHMKSVHENNMFVCDICEFKSPFRKVLKNHVEMRHKE